FKYFSYKSLCFLILFNVEYLVLTYFLFSIFSLNNKLFFSLNSKTLSLNSFAFRHIEDLFLIISTGPPASVVKTAQFLLIASTIVLPNDSELGLEVIIKISVS